MRALVVLVVSLGVGCSSDDTIFHGPGGGGHGGTTLGPDADPTAIDAAPAGALTGQVCVIESWTAPFACPAIPLSHDVEVEELATGGLTVTSDATGGFSLPLVDTSGAVIRVGGATADLLVATHAVYPVTTQPVAAPAVDEDLWTTTLATMLETQTLGAGVVYVIDPAGPVVGATISFTTSVPAGMRQFYDDGAGGFNAGGIATGGDGSALLLDLQNVGVRATAADGRTGTALLDTGALEIGIAVITLPDEL